MKQCNHFYFLYYLKKLLFLNINFQTSTFLACASFSNFFNLKYSIWKSKATEKHYLEIPKEGAWTLLLEGKPYHKWGFYVNGKKLRPYEYFHKFGIIQDKKYQ